MLLQVVVVVTYTFFSRRHRRGRNVRLYFFCRRQPYFDDEGGSEGSIAHANYSADSECKKWDGTEGVTVRLANFNCKNVTFLAGVDDGHSQNHGGGGFDDACSGGRGQI